MAFYSTKTQKTFQMTTTADDEQAMGLDDVPPPLPPTLTLISSDGVRFEVPRDAAVTSTLVKAMAEGAPDETEVPLPNISGDVLKKVVDFMVYHSTTPYVMITRPIGSNKMEEICKDAWDAAFVNVTQSDLFDLIMAANYLDSRQLLDLTCCKLASALKGKNTEQIRKTFGITNDFTPEEETRVRNENKWAEDI
jgi:S-phase kinase-associated protein 1